MKQFFKIKEKVLLLFFSIVATSFLNAQRGALIKDPDVLEREQAMYLEAYPHVFEKVIIDSIEKIDPKHSKIFFNKNEEEFEVVVNSDRKDMLLLANCRKIAKDDVPEIVLASFKKEYKTNKIIKAFEVTTPYSTKIYRIDYKDDNKKTRSAFYDQKGQYEKAPY